MKKLCPNCQIVNFANAVECVRCHYQLNETAVSEIVGAKKKSSKSNILRRAIICVAVCFLAVAGFYLSMVFTSSPLKSEEKQQVKNAVKILEEKGFSGEVFLLKYLTNYRGNDNWLNASTKFENAYAATNFPFEIMTIYPEFFTFTVDDTERAAILLHEAQHLKGADEKEAYEFVWRNRRTLGWTKENYNHSVIWLNVRKQTQEFAPNLFVCDWNEARDCTE
ncbi:MAG: hypothetical protein LH472_04940 [Pyrinomonadaceae bacterium]|nr:hypothetical protein [Pyrinomonadaceae bacterium]